MDSFVVTVLFHSLEHWTTKPGSKPLGGSIVDSVFNPSKME